MTRGGRAGGGQTVLHLYALLEAVREAGRVAARRGDVVELARPAGAEHAEARPLARAKDLAEGGERRVLTVGGRELRGVPAREARRDDALAEADGPREGRGVPVRRHVGVARRDVVDESVAVVVASVAWHVDALGVGGAPGQPPAVTEPGLRSVGVGLHAAFDEPAAPRRPARGRPEKREREAWDRREDDGVRGTARAHFAGAAAAAAQAAGARLGEGTSPSSEARRASAS